MFRASTRTQQVATYFSNKGLVFSFSNSFSTSSGSATLPGVATWGVTERISARARTREITAGKYKNRETHYHRTCHPVCSFLWSHVPFPVQYLCTTTGNCRTCDWYAERAAYPTVLSAAVNMPRWNTSCTWSVWKGCQLLKDARLLTNW